MDSDRESETYLVRGVLRRDAAALAELCRRYGAPLYTYACYRLGGDREGAQEVAQDTLLEAVRGMSSFRGEGKLFSWLCGIARHKAVDYRRARAREPVPFCAIPGVELARMTDRAPLPEEIVENNATRALVVEALWSVREEYRRALVARYVEGMSVEELAGRLGRSYKAAESLLSRAKVAFRHALEKVGADGEG